MEKKLKDMSTTVKEREKALGYDVPMVAGGSKGSNAKVYPWGLEIRLDNVALEKLGIKDLPDAGTECVIHGVGKVTEVRQSATEEKKSRNVSIQITKLAIEHGEDADKAFEKGFNKGPKRSKGY